MGIGLKQGRIFNPDWKGDRAKFFKRQFFEAFWAILPDFSKIFGDRAKFSKETVFRGVLGDVTRF
jgi:hypothetical protein